MYKCLCGSKMIWQNDFNLDDVGELGEGYATFQQCPDCGLMYEIIIKEDDEGVSRIFKILAYAPEVEEEKVAKKYWKQIIRCNLKYEDIDSKYRYFTRPEWGGFHFSNTNGDYCILTKYGQILVNPQNIQDKDKDDWIEVRITDEALELLNERKAIG